MRKRERERERERALKLLLGDLTSVLHSTIILLPTCVQAVYKANGSETTLSLSGYCSQGSFFKERQTREEFSEEKSDKLL